MEIIHYQSEITAPENKAVLRTAAYCRVSTLSEDQQSSFDTQCAYYRQLIGKAADKELVDIYADQMSGLHMDKRVEFQRMMQDCEDGKIDLIITRSVSRFSRNMGECLEAVNHLKKMNIPVIFEKEKIYSLDRNAELFLSILASMAQEEVGHLSRNMKWAHEHAAQLGKPIRKTAYGYRQDKQRVWSIYEPEASRVRLAFQMASEIKSYKEITDALNAMETNEVTGKKWSALLISKMLKNEVYKGDLLTNKTYKISYLSKQRINHGEQPQYYIEEHHEPVVPKKLFDRVQEIQAAGLLDSKRKVFRKGEDNL